MARLEPKISVVIPTLNRESLITLFATFCKQRRTRLSRLLSSIRVIATSKQRVTSSYRTRIGSVTTDYKGLPKARNHGTRLATGEIVVFVDDDVEPPEILFAHAAPYSDEAVVGVTD